VISHSVPTAYGEAHIQLIGCDSAFLAETTEDRYAAVLSANTLIERLAYTEQVHGAEVVTVTGVARQLSLMGEADALISRDMATALLIRTADCIPILFYSTAAVFAGAVHAGWRGLDKRILTKTLGKANREHGVQVEDLQFVVGPFIGAESYEVGAEVAGQFGERHSRARAGGKFMLDLKSVLQAELTDLGIARTQITWFDRDTLTDTAWFSARRGDSQRNLSLIWLTDGT
jgi:YfiH family protein